MMMIKQILINPNPLPVAKPVYSLLRILFGALLVFHGREIFDSPLMATYAKWEQFQHTFNPLLMVYLGKGIELVAGILLMFGLLTRLAALLIAITMFYICFKVGHGEFWYADQHPFVMGLMGLLFCFIGSGKWSVDSLISGVKLRK